MTQSSHIEIYQADIDQPRIELRLDLRTLWLSQDELSELFEKDARTIYKRLQSNYQESESRNNPTIRKFKIVRHPKVQHTISTTEQSSVVRHNHCHSSNTIHLPV